MKRKLTVLLIVLCIASIFAACTKSGAMTASIKLASAIYPKMAAYPKESSINFNADYDEWRADKTKLHNQPEGYSNGLENFFIDSAKTFLSGAKTENRTYSPLNVYMALCMLAETTGGNSQAQILKLLGSDSIESLRAQAASVWLASYNNDGAYTSILANSLWLNNKISFNQSTMDTLATDYYASSFSGEMGSAEYNKALQYWLNEQTGGLLAKQASGIEMDPETILTLATTIYFKAKWNNEFNEAATTQNTFYGAAKEITCDFMNMSRSDTYYYSENFSAISKAFEGGGKMWFFLPDEGTTPEKLLTDSKLFELYNNSNAWADKKHLVVNMSIPKFDIASDIDLCDGLKALGITEVFDSAVADFTPMTADTDEIALSSAKHAARVTIDEEGCTAAAYTVMMMNGTAMPPNETVDFTLNRPFIFVITNQDSLPLFIGIVNQPK